MHDINCVQRVALLLLVRSDRPLGMVRGARFGGDAVLRRAVMGGGAFGRPGETPAPSAASREVRRYAAARVPEAAGS
jgi:hypothetical protein